MAWINWAQVKTDLGTHLKKTVAIGTAVVAGATAGITYWVMKDSTPEGFHAVGVDLDRGCSAKGVVLKDHYLRDTDNNGRFEQGKDLSPWSVYNRKMESEGYTRKDLGSVSGYTADQIRVEAKRLAGNEDRVVARWLRSPNPNAETRGEFPFVYEAEVIAYTRPDTPSGAGPASASGGAVNDKNTGP